MNDKEETLTKEVMAGRLCHDLLAVVTEIRCERPKYAPPSATATLRIFDPQGGQTTVKIPVMAILDQIGCGDRYQMTIHLRKLDAGESFHPANAIGDARRADT